MGRLRKHSRYSGELLRCESASAPRRHTCERCNKRLITDGQAMVEQLCVLKSCGRLSAATARTAFANAQASLARSRALKLRRRHCRPRQRRKKHYIGSEASFCSARRGRKEHRTRLGRPGIRLPLQSNLISGRVAAISSGCRSPGPLGMKPKGFELRAFWGDGA